MLFFFKEEPVDLIQRCLDLDIEGEMIRTGFRFAFHNKTLEKFRVGSDEDLCHRYSFSAMAKLLCIIYNTQKFEELEKLIFALFPYEGEDRSNALGIYRKINSDTSTVNMIVEYFNFLLYLLNNSLSNLRPGKSHWNRSIGEVYDPVEWIYDKEEQAFYITDDLDIYMLHLLVSIDINKSTLSFYTAMAPNNDPIMYSSNNPDEYEGIESYEEFYRPIYIISNDINGYEIKINLTN